MGVLYYVIYNPLRKRKPRLEMYQLEQGKYILQSGELVWLAELKLGIGRDRGTYQGITREWLYWYDQQGKRYPTPEERILEAQQQIREAQKRAQRLEERLRSFGIDPNEL